jgi:hypothetical protein
MTPHAQQLRNGFLAAMGLSTMSLTLFLACKAKDVDGDGFVADQDCDDSRAEVNADAEEVCDGVDNNCDGVIDTDASDRSTWYTDTDTDGYGDALGATLACEAPAGSVADNTDCDPEQAEIHPGAEEQLQDQLDNDCDGMIDEMACPEATIPSSVEEVQATRAQAPLMFCVELPEDGQSCPSPDDIQAQELVNDKIGKAHEGTDSSCEYYASNWQIGDSVCGPDETTPASCCYVFQVGESCVDPGTPAGPTELLRAYQVGDAEAVIGSTKDPGWTHGRPLTVHGAPRTAPTAVSGDWSGVLDLDLTPLTSAQRNQLAQAWQQAALYEHASVASFARFTLELMALEAPPELLAAATRAQGDEIAHARACFAMASSFAGSPLGPGSLDLSGAMDQETTPQGMLVQTILEGCVNETLAAAEAAWLSEQTEIETIRQVQKQIAEDESRHAALGWKTVRWLLQRHPELVGAAQEAFEQALEATTANRPQASDDTWMAPYGSMPTSMKAALRADVWEQVITPCAQALLSASKGYASLDENPQGPGLPSA